jgi:hypothetical protein
MNHPEPHDLTALAYALVSGPEREQLLEHIASCDGCRETYDAAFEEQAQVREVMFEEVRSGEAEARALDKVLQALKTGQVVSEEKQSKIFSLFSPFAIGLQIAAALLIAAGVFYISIVLPSDSDSKPDDAVSRTGGTEAKTDIPAKGGNLLVMAEGTPELENARWEHSTAVPMNVWCRNDSETPVTFSLSGADLKFDGGAYFQLQPVDGQVSVYMLRGDASVSNSTNVLRVLTNTNEFRAMPGTTFDVECQYAFMPSQRGKEVASKEGQTLVRAEVQKGEVIFVPSGDVWESSRGGVLRPGRSFGVQSVRSGGNQGFSFPTPKWRAEGAEFDSQSLEEAIGRIRDVDPKIHNELRVRFEGQIKDLSVATVVLKIVRDGIELTQQHGNVEIKNPKCTVLLTIDDDNYVVAEVTINGETQTYKASNLDELVNKCPAIAELLGAVTIETPATGKRKVSVKRAVYEQQELHEEQTVPQKQSQKVK